jgi:signal transduction histidine kinase
MGAAGGKPLAAGRERAVSSAGRTRARALVVDGALAAVLTLVCLLTAPVLDTWGEFQRQMDWLGLILIVFSTAALALRRRYPVTVLAVSTVAVSAYLALGYPYGPTVFAVAIAVYTVARRELTSKALLLAAAVLALLLVHIFTNDAALPGALGIVPATAWVAIPLTIGIARRLVDESRARERVESERRRIDEERLRLAQEVHDIVGHGLAAIQMQADIALHLGEAKPDQGRLALEAISRASASALAELRATLSSIAPSRVGDTTSGAEQSRAPTPGIDRLEDLCARVGDAGIDVELTINGERRRVSAEVDVAVYRVVQESLTNVLKHAAQPRASVELTYSSGTLALLVTSPHTGDALTEGFGIRGMRRRIEELGGELVVAADEKVHVRAVIPTTD